MSLVDLMAEAMEKIRRSKGRAVIAPQCQKCNGPTSRGACLICSHKQERPSWRELRLVDQEDRDRCREVCSCRGCTVGPYDPTHGLLDLSRQMAKAFGGRDSKEGTNERHHRNDR